MSGQSTEQRDAELAAIRRTYERYEAEGRDGIWDPANPGYRRIRRDRDAGLVALIQASLPGGSGSVVDVGAGRGDLSDASRRELPDISWTGVDLLPESVAIATQKHPWASWVAASADQLPFANASFDVAVASTLFSSLPSRALETAVAHEIARVLRPGGWLVWYDLRYSNPRNPAVHGIGADRISELFPGWQRELRAMTLIPPIARHLGSLTPVMYPLLERLPILRSHLIGRVGRPRMP